MARSAGEGNAWKPKSNRKNKRTSIGSSKNSRPKNKHLRRCKGRRAYRGQGK